MSTGSFPKKQLDWWRVPTIRRDLLLMLAVFIAVRVFSILPMPYRPEGVSALFRADPDLALVDILAGKGASKFSVLALGLYPYLLASLLANFLIFFQPHSARDSYELTPELRDLHSALTLRLTPLFALLLGSLYLFLLASLGINLPVSIRPILTLLILLTAGSLLVAWFSRVLGKHGAGLILATNVIATLPLYLPSPLQAPVALAFQVITLVAALYLYLMLTQKSHFEKVIFPRKITRTGKPLTTTFAINFRAYGLLPMFYLLLGLGVLHYFSLLIFDAPQTQNLVWQFAAALNILTDPASLLFWLIFFLAALPLKLAFVRADVNNENLAQKFKEHGGQIPGIAPGKATEHYIRDVTLKLAQPDALATLALITVPAVVNLIAFPNQPNFAMLLIALFYAVQPVQNYLAAAEQEVKSRA